MALPLAWYLDKMNTMQTIFFLRLAGDYPYNLTRAEITDPTFTPDLGHRASYNLINDDYARLK
jgi:hypothetical protein